MSGYRLVTRKCAVCSSIMESVSSKEDLKTDFYIDFMEKVCGAGRYGFVLKLEDSKFYLASRDSHDSGKSEEMRLNFCPICGKRLSVSRFARGSKKRG